MSWRRGVDANLTPLQQSLTADMQEYEHYRMNTLYTGVILEVYPSDSDRNRTAQQSEQRRGYMAEAKVLLVGTNTSSNLVVDHVAIPAPFPAGLDDYSEVLPRPSTNRVDGEDMSSSGAHINPYDLDGDWCVVGFVGGSLDQPFILTWWPHPRNSYDAATSGNGNPNRSGEGQALDQAGRSFKRTNGVEYVVTNRGDIYLTTTYANSRLTFDSESSDTRGRWTRETNDDEGGSILVTVKPTQTFELSWDEPQDGAGVRRGNDPSIPQSNPRSRTGNASTVEREKTYVILDEENIHVETTEEIKLKSRTRIIFNSDDETTISATNVLTLESTSILLGENAEDAVIKGDTRYADERQMLTALQAFVSTLSGLDVTGPNAVLGPIKTAATTFLPLLQSFVSQVNGTTHLSTKVSTE